MARGWLAPVIELYLPPDPGGERVVEAARTAFRPLLRLLERRPGAVLTVALDPGLAGALLRHGQAGILQDLAGAVERGQVELAGGALAHALLPRLPRREVERQIRLGHERLREAMGRSWRPQGLLPPALAWSRHVAEVAADRGLHWVLADELALGRLGAAPRRRVAALRGRPDVLLFFRDRAASRALATGAPVDADGGYRVAVAPGVAFVEGGPALDALDRLLAGGGPALATPSALASLFADREAVEPLPCSARTSVEELAAGIPFAAWSAPDDEVQAMLWQLARLAIDETERIAPTGDPAAARVRRLVDEGLHSAPFRFASERWWRPDVVRGAADGFVRALAAGGGAVDGAVLDRVRDLRARLEQAIEAREGRGARPDPAAPADAPEVAG